MLRWIVVSTLSTLALTACGEDGDEQAIRDTIGNALTTTDPKICAAGDTFTNAFVEQAAFGSKAVALEYERVCRSEIENLAATSVSVSDVSVNGDRAKASFATSGGAYVFARATVELRKEDDRWRLGRFTAVDLNRPEWDRQQAKIMLTGRYAGPREQASCFERRLQKVGDATLETAFVKSDIAVLTDPLLVCVTRAELRQAGLTGLEARCAILRLRRDPDELERGAFAGTEATQRKLDEEVVKAVAVCARTPGG